MPTTLRERIEGGLLGLLVGDALGVPYEFHPPTSIPPAHLIEFTPPEGFRRAHAGVPPGTWSDDGAQALALLDSLLACGRLDPGDLARRLLDWGDSGRYTPDGRVFDIGITTDRAFEALRSGTPPDRAGPASERDNGNGSLMRVLPLTLWHQGNDAQLVEDARLQSRVTHGHARAQACCALYCLWARRLLHDHPAPYADALETLRALADDDALMREVEPGGACRFDDPPAGRGTGYVLDCLHSARLALESGPYETAVRAAVALGNDTDTTACVAGGLAGLRDGPDAIPDRWRLALKGRDLVQSLLDPLLDHAAP